ncbi:porin [Litorivicinus lipolyticus]|uniref:porin n=1 Tax=Litorivicinus lipolyticus TaxID=418701 RepID=UPI003B5A9178
MTVSTGITLWNAGNALNNDGGEGSITLAGSFGSLSVGDVAGPLDALDGVAVATPENDLSNGQGADMALRYDLPTFVEGLTLHVGMSAENGGDAGVMSDATGFGASYSVAGFKVFAGTESAKAGVQAQANATATAAAVSGEVASDFDTTGYGVAYSMGGFTVGYNTSEKKFDVASRQDQNTELSGFSAGYAAGNFSVAINTSDKEVNNATVEETQTVGAAYNMGGGVKVYAASTSNDKGTAADENTVGISFSF